MKPKQIRVFDGLRITTEHMDHLQGSFHSALQDMREILGLGKVFYGFRVIPKDAHTITVQPGLAFDFQKNRIVCDEPKSVEVTFKPEEDSQYVCLKYDQVEGGQVEGRFTLIWDNCSVLLRPTLPEPRENLIPIAKLIRSTEGEGVFQIIGLLPTEQAEESKEVPNGKTEFRDQEITEESEKNKSPEELGTPLKEKDSPASATEGVRVREGIENSPSEKSPSGRISWRLRVRQGIERLGADSEVSGILLEPLKKKLNGEDPSQSPELLFTLTEKEVMLDFPVSSLSCQTIISANYRLTEDHASLEVRPIEEKIPQEAKLELQSIAQGEVTFTDPQVTQYGLSKIQSYPSLRWENIERRPSLLTEFGIASLPLGLLLTKSENENLQFFVWIDKGEKPGFKIVCKLLWKGGVTGEMIQKLETQKLNFTWETLLAWKALGESPEKEDM
jgi:hypothetical protein